MNKIIFSIILLGFCIPWGGCENQEKKPADTDYGVLNPQRDFTLHDQDGKIFHLKDHRGKSFFYFLDTHHVRMFALPFFQSWPAYMRSWDLCGKRVLAVFITIDPQRDTPQKLKEYLQYFNINALGLSGTKQQIDAVVDKYKATYGKVVIIRQRWGICSITLIIFI